MIIDFDIIERIVNKTLEKKGFHECSIDIDNCKFYDATDLSGGNAYIQVDYTIIDQSKSLVGGFYPMDNMNIRVSDYITAFRDYKIGDILK